MKTLTRKDTSALRLEWTDGRWHCEGKAVGNGDRLELLCPDARFWPCGSSTRTIRSAKGPG